MERISSLPRASRSAPGTAAASDGPVAQPVAIDARVTGFREADGTLRLGLSGDWSLAAGIPSVDALVQVLDGKSGVERVRLDGSGLQDWSSSLVTFLRAVQVAAADRGLSVDLTGLPQGVQRMLQLADRRTAQGGRKAAEPMAAARPVLTRLGDTAIDIGTDLLRFTAFLGDVILAGGRALAGRGQFRGREFWQLIEDSGPRSLPIVMLISFLCGIILVFVGATQLKWFGAELYVANLVTMGMAKEMAPLMTAMIMTGRTGAAYAAELGSMNVNEEIDAFQTMGIGAIDFLVLPRILALSLMMPLLALFANLLGILGGSVIGQTMLGISFLEFFVQAQQWIRLSDFVGGLFKAWVFGLLIGLAGCYYGLHCGRHSAAVGEATTATVVTSVVLVVIADALLTVIYTVLRGY